MLGKQKQKDGEFKTNLGYSEDPFSKDGLSIKNIQGLKRWFSWLSVCYAIWSPKFGSAPT